MNKVYLTPSRILLWTMGLLFLLGQSSRAEKQAPTAGAKTQAVPVTGVTVQPASTTALAERPAPAYKSYTYYGDRYRDPFIPLNGDFHTDQKEIVRPPQIASLLLKGIVQDTKGRMALLTSGQDSYILKGGRLYDGRNRMVKKIAGVIKTESVVLIGADRTVKEVRTKSSL